MSPKERLVWRYALAFLQAYRPLRYDGIPLAPLLLRHVQRYLNKRTRLLKKGKLPPDINPKHIQKRCAPFFPKSDPDYSKKGFTLVRAQLYLVSKDQVDESFLYVAHHRKEYRKMRHKCRPLIYLPAVKEARIAKQKEQKLWRSWKAVCASHRTHPFFRTLTFRKWIKAKIKQTLKKIRKVRTLFNRYPIARVIYGSTINPEGSLLATMAQVQNIPVINIQHGIFGPLGHLPVNADLNFVWGTSHAQFLQKYGAPKEKIFISGPFFYRNLERKSKLRLCSHRERPLKTVLVALQPLGYTYNRTLISCIEKAASGLSLRVIYKLHPDQGNGQVYKRLLKRKYSQLVPHGSIPLPQLFQEAKLVVTPFSSVAYEALLHHIPVYYYGKRKQIYYLQKRPPFFRTARQLRPVLARIVNEPDKALSDDHKLQLLDINLDGNQDSEPLDPLETIWSVIQQKKEEAVTSCNVWPSSPPGQDPKVCLEKTS
jgi:hypothetical protein